MENMVNFQQLENVYKGKKVFLTGHTGFKGAWMLKTLSLLGAEIKGYALEPKTPNDLFQLIEGEKLCHSLIADLRDKKRLESEIVAFQPDFVFHLAAQPLVRLSYEIPAETFEVNVIGTANVLDAVKLLKNKCSVVLITTDKVYHNYEQEYPYFESDRLGGFDPYSNSKGCAELVSSAYRNSFVNVDKYKEHGVALATARAGNVIGGGDWAEDRLIPDFMRAIQAKQKVSIRNPYAIRSWQHVLEPLQGYLILCQKLYEQGPEFAESFNFGPNENEAKSVEWVAKEITKSWADTELSYEIEDAKNIVHEAQFLKLNSTKANEKLNWFSKLHTEEAIKKITDWHKSHLDKKDMRTFSLSQINEYENLL